MQFTKLRLAGFKSFVEPTDFQIEPGLTGIVGPNGCGKSNLLEALRWVMGASSAKALRGEGMDDVIFAGARDRPPRSHAEVTLTVDNAERRAPAQFNAHAVLEVVRRIDRGDGSTYRINGAEVRARDVQLLFADASTGANSPALVRQGQISELIGAKPQNRRRILEEAAGISGLHSRRHEAELRIRAAEANMARLDDLMRELESNLGRLRREARTAARYKVLAAQVRVLRGAVMYGRWADAQTALQRLQAEGAGAHQAAETAARAAALATTAALTAQSAIAPLRDEETAAAAVLHHLAIEKDRLDRALDVAAAEATRLTQDLQRIDADAAREDQITEDAQGAQTRLEAARSHLAAQIAAAPQHLPKLRAELSALEARRSAAEATLEALAGQLAASQAERRAAQTRVLDAQARRVRTQRALEKARQDRDSLGGGGDPQLNLAEAERASAAGALTVAQAAMEAAEQARGDSARAEQAARQAARAGEDELSGLTAEARGLAKLSGDPAKTRFAAALESITPDRGLEAALAAALGDDLNAALDPAAPAFWGGGDAEAPVWPPGAQPLAPLISAPPQLAARLALTALTTRAEGPLLQKALCPGARLVSKEGDLWRWDGFTARADSPKPAQVRLEQKARLADLIHRIDVLTPKVEKARADQAAANGAFITGEEAVRAARQAVREGETRMTRAREALEQRAREGARKDAQIQSLNETISRFEVEEAEALTAERQAQVALNDAPPEADLAAPLEASRLETAAAREAAALARAALDQEQRQGQERTRRLEDLTREAADWAERSKGAARRRDTLAKDRQVARAALDRAKDAPEAVDLRRRKLMDELETAETRRARSGDALAAGEAARAEADRLARATEAAASEAREARASLVARLEGAQERLADHAGALTEATGLTPQTLGEQLAAEGRDKAPDPVAAEARLVQLERDRDAIGAVNLRAEDEAAELATRLNTMVAERADLSGALGRLRAAVAELNEEGRTRLTVAFGIIDGHFRSLFTTLFQGGQAELRLVESEDPLEAGLEIFACPPGKRMAVMSLMSGGEQALTAVALIFAVFLANPAPICVLDEVDAPLDDANVARFCDLLAEMRNRAPTRFITITHNPVTMARMDRLFGVTMRERGVSQLVSVDLKQAEVLAGA